MPVTTGRTIGPVLADSFNIYILDTEQNEVLEEAWGRALQISVHGKPKGSNFKMKRDIRICKWNLLIKNYFKYYVGQICQETLFKCQPVCDICKIQRIIHLLFIFNTIISILHFMATLSPQSTHHLSFIFPLCLLNITYSRCSCLFAGTLMAHVDHFLLEWWCCLYGGWYLDSQY